MKREGFDDGKAAGLAEGEKIKALEIAKAMKEENLDIETIARVSGLPKEKIETL